MTKIILTLIIGLGFLILMGVVWWNIFEKAGYAGKRGLLMLIPIVDLIVLLMFAFSTWPIQKDQNNTSSPEPKHS